MTRDRPKPDQPLRYKSSYMQRIADLVRRGYHHWTAGEIAVEKLPRLRSRFDTYYGTAADETERRRQRRHGIGRAWLVIYAPPKRERVEWVLLTEQDHVAERLERLHDARKQLERVQTPIGRSSSGDPAADYELVRIEGTWTWRMTRERKDAWRQRIKDAVRTADPEDRARRMRQVAWSLARVPGFRGVRTDAIELIRLARADWQRVRSGPPPARFRRPGWMRRQPQR